MKLKAFIIIGLLLYPLGNLQASSSDIIFTEIMYDLAGTDDKHEWVEIYNASTAAIVINDDWRFYDGTAHLLNIIQGEAILAPRGVAVIADDATTFLNNHPGFNGLLLDSVVKLSNDGEEIKLSLDDGSNWIAQVTYAVSSGANGDGKTLELINEQWQAGEINGTPGQYSGENSCNCQPEEINNDPIVPPPPPTPPEPISADIKIVINELCADPAGNDEEQEFIELYNVGTDSANLIG
ncbi:MAG: hypothetical protein CO133_02225, partial [Candidatus Komeilibacteria bacterium CG_4_9_14_3_um_filter_37_5]